MDFSTYVNTVVLTTAVLAALIGSLTNIFLSLLNNDRLKKIEQQKQASEIDKYRYTKLYELVINWHKYDSPYSGESAGAIAFNRLVNSPLDNSGRYDIARPLLDKCYTEQLDIKRDECMAMVEQLVSYNQNSNESGSFFSDTFCASSREFEQLLKDSINNQFEVLLKKDSSLADT